jgi:hypothetical protein
MGYDLRGVIKIKDKDVMDAGPNVWYQKKRNQYFDVSNHIKTKGIVTHYIIMDLYFLVRASDCIYIKSPEVDPRTGARYITAQSKINKNEPTNDNA